MQMTEYQCPNCGWDDADENPMLSCTDGVLSTWAQMEYGGNPVDWTETHKCPMCGTVFELANGNY